MNKLIIIESDPIFSSIYTSTFRGEGFAVECFATGKEGLEAVLQSPPNVVLLDLGMKDIGGKEILCRLRSQPSTKNLPVVVMTASYSSKAIEDAWKAGATRCLRKPECTPKAVLETVLRAITLQASAAAGAPVPLIQAAAAPAASIPAVAALSSQEVWRANFFSQARGQLTLLRRAVHLIAQTRDEAQRTAGLTELERTVHTVASEASVRGFREIAQLAGAFEALARELRLKPKTFTPSTNHTLVQSVDFLGNFIGQWISMPDDASPLSPNILVVDDDATSRSMVQSALEMAGLNCIALASSPMALAALELNTFDLVFFDVNMPELTGFELCEKMRTETDNTDTPVVFVTIEADFNNRARSAKSGAVDFISKPFPQVELAIKSLCHLFAQRLNQRIRPDLANAA